jgi:hypothetical protein
MPLEGQRARTLWHPPAAAVHITNTKAGFPKSVCYCETRAVRVVGQRLVVAATSLGGSPEAGQAGTGEAGVAGMAGNARRALPRAAAEMPASGKKKPAPDKRTICAYPGLRVPGDRGCG